MERNQTREKKAHILICALIPTSGISDNSFYILNLSFHICKISVIDILSHFPYTAEAEIEWKKLGILVSVMQVFLN
jgi:hypothetical protein